MHARLQVPLDVACAISNSKNDEISKAVLADLVWYAHGTALALNTACLAP